MYNGYKHQISNQQLEKQAAMLEETMGKRKAAKALGLDPDCGHWVTELMDERLKLAFWQIDNWDAVCKIEGTYESGFCEFIIADECVDNGVNVCTCPQCSPDSPYYGDDEALPFMKGMEK